MILGPTRGGKGVITKTLSSLVGKRSVCSPKLDDLGQRFGLEPTLGKSLATVSDMRLGSRSDKQNIVGNLLRIVGEDEVDVERKHIGGAWTGKLGIRIFIATNMMPPLPDVSGALIARLVTLTTKRSFAGEEDPGLGSALQAELPGILNWAINGWKRLRQNGKFLITQESKHVAEKMADLASPLNAFLRERCVLDPSAQTPRDEIWKAYDRFVLMHDLPTVYSASNYFHRDLEVAAQHRIIAFRPRIDGKQVKCWKGIRLLPQDDD